MKKIIKYIILFSIFCLLLSGCNKTDSEDNSNLLTVNFTGLSQADNNYIIKINWDWSSMTDDIKKDDDVTIDISWLTASEGGKPIYSKYNNISTCTIYYYDNNDIVDTVSVDINTVHPFKEIEINYPWTKSGGWAKSGEIILNLSSIDESIIKEINYIFKHSHNSEIPSLQSEFINFPLGLALNISIQKETIIDTIVNCLYDCYGETTVN